MRLQVACFGVDFSAAGDVAVVDAGTKGGLGGGGKRLDLLTIGTRAVRSSCIAPHGSATRARGETRSGSDGGFDRRRRRAAHFATARGL